MRVLLFAALVAAATPALADQTGGTVARLDDARHALTLDDKTVWLLPADTALPANLTAGDKVLIVYTSNADNGWSAIHSITRPAG